MAAINAITAQKTNKIQIETKQNIGTADSGCHFIRINPRLTSTEFGGNSLEPEVSCPSSAAAEGDGTSLVSMGLKTSSSLGGILSALNVGLEIFLNQIIINIDIFQLEFIFLPCAIPSPARFMTQVG